MAGLHLGNPMPPRMSRGAHDAPLRLNGAQQGYQHFKAIFGGISCSCTPGDTTLTLFGAALPRRHTGKPGQHTRSGRHP